MFSRNIFSFIGRSLMIALIFASLTASGAHADRSTDCTNSTSLSVNTTEHQYGTSLGAPKIFEVTPSSAGILTFDVASPGQDSERPKLTVHGTDCVNGGGAGTDYNLVKSNPTGAVLEMLASETVYVQIEPEGSQATLSGYKLRVAFNSEPSTSAETVSPSSDATDTCSSSSTGLASNDLDGDFIVFSESIDEWDSDVMSGAMASPGVLTVASSGQDLDASLYADDGCDSASLVEDEVILDGSGTLAAVVFAGAHSLAVDPYNSASGSYSLEVKHYDICGVGETDDHGSNWICASQILVDGASVSGSISNTDDDDDDFLAFVLTAQTTVEITSSGSTDVYGNLYDSGMQLLEGDDDDGSGTNFSITRTLGAGRYFIRVDGKDQAEGSYSVSVSDTAP